MIHFLHTADWQIGRQYGQFDAEDAALLSEARLKVVQSIAASARDLCVDAVLVAGDVFDTQSVSDRTIRRLFAGLSAYGGPWVLLAGNHDAALADSVWTRARQLECIPPNVIIPEATSVVDLAAIDLAVLSAPLTQRHTYDDVTAAFDTLPSPPGRYRVGLAHGSVAGRLDASIDSANPVAEDRADRARLDYLALGDWHGCLQVGPRTWYAGTPETDRFRGNDPGFVLSVRIHAPGAMPQVERIATGVYRWSAWEEKLVVGADVQTLAHRLSSLTDRDVLRLELQGSLTLHEWEQLQTALGQAEARVRALRVHADGVVLAPDQEDLRTLGAVGYVGEVVDRLQAMQALDGEQAATARAALRLLAMSQRELASVDKEGTA